MSTQTKNNRKTILDIKKMKELGEKITMLTAYDNPIAAILDACGIDMILVGDSLGNVILGYDDTIPVTMEDMLHHTKAVTRAARNTMVVSDMPFLSYQVSPEQALINAGRFLKEAGAQAVKLEGGRETADTVRKITAAGIPVMGHLGLRPQSINQIGGWKVQGKKDDAAQHIMEDAKILEDAGAFSIVLELVPEKLAAAISKSLSIPTIGIGGGVYCDGQVLVVNDMLGMFDKFTPKHVKKYANLSQEIKKAVEGYINDVKSGAYPDSEHSFK